MNQQKFQRLRNEFPIFNYDGYHWEIFENRLNIVYHLSNGIYHFNPTYIIPITDSFSLTSEILENLIFQLGLCETISYWKATCSPVVKIKPFGLNQEAVEWWKKLFYNGLGEFRYLNGIECYQENFVNFEFEAEQSIKPFYQHDNQGVLIPVGGGKDSAVTLELLKQIEKQKFTFTLNQSPAATRSIIQAGYDEHRNINVLRTISPTLLKMNDDGFLNGHTPFSALLAFVTTFVSALYQIRYIALSNESSANESTIAGTNINHQYSKTIEFERDFRAYSKMFISPDIEYFSFLRPIFETEIAKLFSRFPQHHSSFRSCNKGSKTDVWCGSCSKCLFVWIILSPYLSTEELIKIFGKNLEEDFDLLDDFQKLTGIADEKPFECIGTIDEVRESIVRAYNHNEHKGILYQYFMDKGIQTLPQKTAELSANFLPNDFLQILKNAIHE